MKLIGTSSGYSDEKVRSVIVRFEDNGKRYVGYVDFSPRSPQGEVVEVSDELTERPVGAGEVVKAEILRAALTHKKP
jgi:hypothetical protein